MKPVVQRRRSASAISKALSKTKARELIFPLSDPDNGLLAGAFSSPDSTFLLDERVQLTVGLQTQERHLFLFSDRLIVAKSKSPSNLKMKKQVRLSEVWTGSCLSEVSEKKMSPENSFVLGWPTINFIVTYSLPEVKERWLSTLLWHINEMKQNEHPKSFPMQILWMSGSSSSCNTTISVSNMETADNVIKKTTQNLGLLGRPSDYYLWVISGRDDPAYPLIGHEHPFSIIFGGLQDSLDQFQGTNNGMQLSDENETSLLDQLPRDRQCQFLLKPKPQAPVQLQRETFHKLTRRKKSLIDWALRRSTNILTASPASQSPTTPRKLFGLSLTSVCPDGSLPKPIMDILQLLYQEGPSTRGIFRRSANAKIWKGLKEKLNSGDDVRVDRESVFVAAAVITDFLRNIPDSVLSSEMHSLWMKAMDKETRAHKIEAVKSLVNQLPEANLILLRHLFGVLHHIEQNSMENQMNAFNLALCIAPNMLWLPSPTGPEEESKSTKKVAMLVQFLIENSAEVFGGDVALLFRGTEKQKSGSLDNLLAQHNDSSDEMEYATSYQEMSKQHYVVGTREGIFAPPGEKPEEWDLFSEITACYQSKAWKNASVDSYGLLEEEASFCSEGSMCSLSPARYRCSSEPSVCLSSQLPTQDHEPVARQSSCDAALMHGQGDHICRLQQLQLESQKLINEGLSPGLSGARQTSWRRSPGPSGSLAKSFTLQKSTLSNRSSFSSLSSATTSPSASSLSSLDSAFSYCSEASAFSPTDLSPLPLMFGTSARLHASSPKVAKRSSKEWHKPLTSPLPLKPGTVELCIEKGGRGMEGSRNQGQVMGFVPTNALESLHSESSWEEGEKEVRKTGILPQALANHGTATSSPSPPVPHLESNPLVSQQVQREKSVKHIEIKGLEAAPRGQERLKRTKVTVYMAPKERSPRASPVRQEDEDVATSTSSGGSSNPNAPKNLHTVRVNIPQTVFYGQSTPLVLQSTSRRYHRKLVTQPPQVIIPPSDPLLEDSVQQVAVTRSHSKEHGSSTVSHTFRILLPTSIRNTIREYFSHDSPKSCYSVDADAVESELVRSRAEWLRNQPCASPAAKEQNNLMLAEETFV
ncbi:rho GTPase-activating protein 20-like isoform X2 [Sphaerodactylus townsendi]|uniref:rho GTPase-activating protein 20-like isoform X2 n=1 Tax=Sphaerodactylus townsendi TaxID=933632 RepID=UPI002025B6CE|nr:rho GTPase-activating protein 20-like isoform X2 [Sphaerodactylus townsendi]